MLTLSLLLFAGCGEGEGVADGATVTAYVALPLCGEAKRELESEGARAGEVKVRLICLARTGGPGRLDLAAVGANARRATEDATSVAYIEDRGPGNRFARPIVEEAGIAWVAADSGADAVAAVLDAIEAADSSALRDSVSNALSNGST